MSDYNAHSRSEIDSSASRYRWAVFAVVASVLAAVLFLLTYSLHAQHRNYQAAISSALSSGSDSAPVVVLSLNRAFDFTVVKTSTVFLGFVLVLIGCLFVLRVADAAYSISLRSGENPELSLQTASSGLVIVTLGVVAVALSLYARTYVSLDVNPVLPSGPSGQAAVGEDRTESLRALEFVAGSSELAEGQRTNLEANCAYLRAHPGVSVSLRLQSSMDQPEELSLALFERRQAKLRRVLHECGSQPQQIRSISFGESPPAGAGASSERAIFDIATE